MAEYIKREAALHEIERREVLMVGDKRISVDAMKSFIKNRPAADVAPVRHAYWVPEEHADQVSPTTIHRYTGYYCSECGRRLIGYKNQIDAPYCHCGAKMDGDG